MAALPCMNDDGQPAVFIGTLLETGDPFTLCHDCLIGFCVSMAAGMSGVDPEVLAAGLYQLAAENEHTEDGNVPTAAEGAPTDQPPQPAPADDDEGEAASWVENGGPPPTTARAGLTPPAPSSEPADTGGENGGEDDA